MPPSLLADARAALDTGPLCDACLGRPFALLSHGLTNAERGRALRTTLALADDEPVETVEVDPEECWVCEGLCGRFDRWGERAAAALGDVEFSTYQVGTRLPPLLAENDELLREEAGTSAGEPLKSAVNREVGKRLGGRTGAEVDFERPDVVVLLNVERGDVDVQVNPAFVYGRYRKLERDIPQTEWPCRECGGSGTQLGEEGSVSCEHCGGTGYMYERSVEQLVAPHVQEAMGGEDAVFHGAGREDVDARMLGTGRPFVVEVKEPRRRAPDTAALEEQINEAARGAVEVEGLSLATHAIVERVKELDADKTYRAEVVFGEPVGDDDLAAAVEQLEGRTVEQRTPERVAHRRADRVRERTVREISAESVDDTHAVVDIRGEGGLYVKELISGDGGRTEPSLAGLLGVAATVEALDVLEVEGETEPFADEAYLR
jgi:tRNA pseudouridine synthase 10